VFPGEPGSAGEPCGPGALPAYLTVEEAVRALGRVAAYAAWRREPAGTLPELPDVDTGRARMIVAELAAAANRTLGDRGELDELLDLADAADVIRAYDELQRLFGAGVEVSVQRMVAPGVGCVVEAVDDPAFGPVVGFGLGGVASDLMGDRAWRPVPLTDRDAATLVRAPRAAPLLTGYRGGAAVDLDALADLVLRVGRLADEHPQLHRLELNPVLARPDGLSALHASVHIGTPAARPDTGPRRLR
jgi:acyl-CoA synthetase (NDP forming)